MNNLPFQNPQPNPNTSKPNFQLPPNATDCHSHIFDHIAQYPMMDQPAYLPPAVTVNDYLRVLKTLGIDRAVIVHANVPDPLLVFS